MSKLSISEIKFSISQSASGANAEERDSIIKRPGDSDRQKTFMQDGLLTGFGQVAGLYIEEIEKPSVINVPLVGPQIIDFESGTTNLTKEEIQAAKDYYTNFVETTVTTLISKGYENPQNERELTALCKDILSIFSVLWDNSTFAESAPLIGNPAAERKYLSPTNSSCYVVADILNQFGVKSKLVSLAAHTILPLHTDPFIDTVLHCEISDVSIYIDTTSSIFEFYRSEKELKKNCRIIYGEYDFQVPNPYLYIGRGNAKYDLKDYEGAIADYTEAIKLNPEFAPAYNNRGLAKGMLKDYKGAITDYTEAIKLNPKDVLACYNRGNAKYDLEDYNGAIVDFHKAIKLDPEFSEAYCNRGSAKCYFGLYRNAIADFNKAIKLDPEYADAYYNRGLAKYDLEDYEGAIADYTEAIEIDPEYAKAYNNRGCAKDDLKDYESAIADYNKAIEIDPKDADAYYNRGIAYSKLGKTTEAEQDFAIFSELKSGQNKTKFITKLERSK